MTPDVVEWPIFSELQEAPFGRCMILVGGMGVVGSLPHFETAECKAQYKILPTSFGLSSVEHFWSKVVH